MSLPDEIRVLLRKASGPMTAREVRESLDDDYSAEDVGGALSYMAKTGEATRDASSSGSFAYLIDPDFKPKRARVDESSIAPVEPTRGLKVVGKTVKPSKPLKSAPPRKQIARQSKSAPSVVVSEALMPTAASAVTIDRAHLRTLALSLTHLHPEPMPDNLKAALLGSFTAVL